MDLNLILIVLTAFILVVGVLTYLEIKRHNRP